MLGAMMHGKDILDKSRVLEKMRAYFRRVGENGGMTGSNPRLIDLGYDIRCNFNCRHCFVCAPQLREDKCVCRLEIEHIRSLCDQADELGIYEVDIQGGEPLLYPDLFEVIDAVDPKRFLIGIVTNGYLLTEEKARRLVAAGVMKVQISIDGFDAESNDAFRGVDGAYVRAMRAMENVSAAGIRPTINFTATHENVQGSELEEMCRFAKERRYHLFINPPTPSGMWRNNVDIMLTDGDRDRLASLRKQFPGTIYRDLWHPFDFKHGRVIGCNAVNILYVNPHGDVLPCPYIHVKLGNIKERPLQEIVDFGFSIKYFREHSPLCLSGENKDFARKYMSNADMSVMKPMPAKDIFAAEDFI